MEDRAPWEIQLIDMYRTTREKHGRLLYGSFWYTVEGEFLYMRGGSSVRWVALADIEQ